MKWGVVIVLVIFVFLFNIHQPVMVEAQPIRAWVVKGRGTLAQRPSLCSIGDVWFITADGTYYWCSAQNTWTGPLGGASGGKPTFGGSDINSIANGTGANASLAGGILTLAANFDDVVSPIAAQQSTPWALVPSGTAGGAYAACPTPDIGVGQPADPSFWLFKPDVASAGGDTLNVCGEGALALQKLRYGALVNIAANDLQTTGRYLVFKGSATYIVIPAEFRFDEDGTYFYTRLGSSGGAGEIGRAHV